jgi:hypothetical protein
VEPVSVSRLLKKTGIGLVVVILNGRIEFRVRRDAWIG